MRLLEPMGVARFDLAQDFLISQSGRSANKWLEQCILSLSLSLSLLAKLTWLHREPPPDTTMRWLSLSRNYRVL